MTCPGVWGVIYGAWNGDGEGAPGTTQPLPAPPREMGDAALGSPCSCGMWDGVGVLHRYPPNHSQQALPFLTQPSGLLRSAPRAPGATPALLPPARLCCKRGSVTARLRKHPAPAPL